MFTNRKKIKFDYCTDDECAILLNESRHRMDFLDKLKDNIFIKIKESVDVMLNEQKFGSTFVFDEENDFFGRMFIHIILVKVDNINNARNYGGNYYNEKELTKGKLFEVDFEITIGVNDGGQYNENYIKTIIDHEITHLYDDFEWQATGHKPLIDKSEGNKDNFIRDNINSNDGMLKSLAWCLYLDNWVEENAFINQAYTEFSNVGMTRRNVHTKIKSTVAYRNYNKAKIDMGYYIGNNSEQYLKSIYNNILSKYGKIGIPSPAQENNYRNKLRMWSDNIFRHFIKRYCSIVSEYLDNLPLNR